MKVFNKSFDIFVEDERLYILVKNQKYTVHLTRINGSKEIAEYQGMNQLIAAFEHLDSRFNLYIKNNTLFISSNDQTPIFDTVIDNMGTKILTEIVDGHKVQLIRNNQVVYESDNLYTLHPIDDTFQINLNLQRKRRFILLSKIKNENHNMVITYDNHKKEINVFKLLLKPLRKHKDISFSIIDRNRIEILNHKVISKDNQSRVFHLKSPLLKPVKIYGPIIRSRFQDEHIISIISINKKRYFIFNQQDGIYLIRSNPYRVSRHAARLFAARIFNGVLIFGRFAHKAYKAKYKYDQFYLQNNENKIGKFIRPFKGWKLLDQLGFIYIPFKRIKELNRIHTNLLCGDEEDVLHFVKFRFFDQPVKTIKYFKYKDDLVVIRTNLSSNITLTEMPFTAEYKKTSKLAKRIGKVVARFYKNQTINLLFEKKSMKADESAFRVFEVIQADPQIDSKNYFVIDKHSPNYNSLKQRFGKSVIKKYSLRHYTYTFAASNFISSELPNHLFNDRLYVDDLREKLKQTPSVFLQHGIMFAKPVDNPMALGFHKENNGYNIIKNVISSDLEAKEFYKMGYDDQDLIKTGLATLDYAELSEDADKIAYMPTYRYWEESLIYSGDIEKTTYYKSLMNVIHAFEQNGLIDRLLIVPHNKFSEYIYDNMKDYSHIVSPNPSEALRKSVIFITDYSSAIYDAIFRGAYPIFFWEEKDYLIENYQAIPPVNEQNAPGPVAYDTVELIKLIQKSMSQNYRIEEKYKNKYLQINEFHDKRNTKRIVSELKKLDII